MRSKLCRTLSAYLYTIYNLYRKHTVKNKMSTSKEALYIKNAPEMPGKDFDGLLWVTDVTGLDKVTRQDFFFSCQLYFFPHSFSSSYFLPLFHCLISILLFPCASVCGKILVHEFSIFYSHTEWNLLSSGTNTLLWWRACYQITNYKLQTICRATAHKLEALVERGFVLIILHRCRATAHKLETHIERGFV